MIFFFVSGRRTSVRLLGTGRFWCLYCETERDYQHRAYQIDRSVYFVPLAPWGREFVLCPTCDSAFDLECLDESSTAFCDELAIQVPDFARHAQLSLASEAAPGGQGDDWQSMRWVPTPEPGGPRAGLRETLSARSASRRH